MSVTHKLKHDQPKHDKEHSGWAKENKAGDI